MIHYILTIILIMSLICLTALFVKEKNKNNRREEFLTEFIKNATDELKEQYEVSNKELSELIKETKCDLNDRTKAQVERIYKNIESANQTIEEKITEIVSEQNNKMNKIQIDCEKGLNDISSGFYKQLSEGIKSVQGNTEVKFEAVGKALEQMMTENNELRRKLEFFTEISEDSKNLNETEDVKKRENLIQEALAELKISSKSEEISDSNILKGAFKEARNNKKDGSDEAEKILKTPTNGLLSKQNENKEDEVIASASTNAPSILDEEQKMAFTIMNSTNDNLFITGKAGTGKSFLLDVFVRGTGKKVIKLAPTGIAALNIKGATLHSTFGYHNLENVMVEDLMIDTIRLKSEKARILREIDTIIIDEISMVRADIFDKIDKILRIINKSAKPFGGKQMIAFGDLFQLPPIAKPEEQKFLIDSYGGIFFFNSNAYSNGQFGFIELSTNHRQKEDLAFFDILNRIREGKITDEDINNLNARQVKNKTDLRRVLTLFPKKADAERVNQEELERIEAKEYLYIANIIYNAKNNQTPNLEAIFPITDNLRLKRGALVMLVANDPEKRWVNGTMGIIHSLAEDSVHVTIDGRIYEVAKTTFTEKEVVYKNGKIEYQDILKVEQYPIVLAYAITIHKSQGMTYKQVACDISQCFAPGQSYVALSRCSNIGGLHLIEPINSSMMKVEDVVLDFYSAQSSEKTLRKYL